jgi:hypothetical protein
MACTVFYKFKKPVEYHTLFLFYQIKTPLEFMDLTTFYHKKKTSRKSRLLFYPVHIRALTPPYRTNTDTCTHTLLSRHFINTLRRQHVSTLRRPS